MSRRCLVGLFACVLIGLGSALSGSAAEPPVSDLEQLLIDSADGQKDHAALAAYFARKAEDMREAAKRHRAMGKSYGGQDRLSRAGELKSHCDKLAELDEKVASEYDGLAALHNAQALLAQ